jgi:hypothetical protein
MKLAKTLCFKPKIGKQSIELDIEAVSLKNAHKKINRLCNASSQQRQINFQENKASRKITKFDNRIFSTLLC